MLSSMQVCMTCISLYFCFQRLDVRVGNEGTQALWCNESVNNLRKKYLRGHLVLLLWLWWFLCVWEMTAPGCHSFVCWSFTWKSVQTLPVNKWTTKEFRISRIVTVSLGTSNGGKVARQQSWKIWAKCSNRLPADCFKIKLLISKSSLSLIIWFDL